MTKNDAVRSMVITLKTLLKNMSQREFSELSGISTATIHRMRKENFAEQLFKTLNGHPTTRREWNRIIRSLAKTAELDPDKWLEALGLAHLPAQDATVKGSHKLLNKIITKQDIAKLQKLIELFPTATWNKAIELMESETEERQ